MYSEKVMDHFANPRNVGEIENANAVGEVGNAKCGDIMKIYMDIEDDVIKDVKFKTFGCGAAIATSSMATEMVKGKSVDEALKLSNKAVMEALDGLPPVKVHCSCLAEEALHASDRKHGIVFPAGGCGINEFARYHFPVLGCDRNSLRYQHHTRNCQRSTHPAKIRKGNGRK